MHLPSFSTIAVIALAALVAFGSITNALLLLFRTLGLTRAANLTAQIGGFAATAVHIVTDLREHPDAQGAKAALDELDELAEQQPTVARPITVATSKARAFLRLIGIGAAILLMALLAGGCARPLDTAVVVVNSSQAAIVDTHDQLKASELEEVQRAVDAAADRATAEAAVAKIEAKYSKRWFLYSDVRLAWLAARATVDEAQSLEAAHMNVDEADIVTALAVLGQAWGNLAAEVGPQIKNAISGGVK